MNKTELARSFPAQPARRGSGRFARSWWGNAWIQAMQDTSLDPEPLVKGRRYAYSGHVGAITVSPGRISAAVHDGDHDTPYPVMVFVEQLGDADWDRFFDEVAGKAGHIAALLDRDMPHDLVQAAHDAGVRLLPGPGDLAPQCDCPDWEYPCKHAAALCFQVSWLLDADPFVLLLLRGRGERELLAELSRRNARHGDAAATVPQPARGTTPRPDEAHDAYARAVPPLPAAPTIEADAPVAALPVLAAPAGIDPNALSWLVADAAARARELLAADGTEAVAPTGTTQGFPDTTEPPGRDCHH